MTTTDIDTVSGTDLTDADRPIIASYRSAISEHVDTMNKARQSPSFATISAHRQARALTGWWQALELLADRVTPGDPAADRYINDQRVKWFRARETALFACVNFVESQGMLNEPTIPRPEDPRTGLVGDGYGYFGYAGIDERLACNVPVDVHLRIGTDGSVSILRPDADPGPPEAQMRRT